MDWSENCGNLSAAVGLFAVTKALLPFARIPLNVIATARMWQENIGKTIIVEVPVRDAEVQDLGNFELDGVTFAAAEMVLVFLDPAAGEDGDGKAMFPT